MSQQIKSLNVIGLGLSCGVLWSLAVFFLGIMASGSIYGHQVVILLGDIYLGYEPTLLGSLIGMVWAFIDAFIGGALLAALYNYFVPKLTKK